MSVIIGPSSSLYLGTSLKLPNHLRYVLARPSVHQILYEKFALAANSISCCIRTSSPNRGFTVPIIIARELSKHYQVADKKPGLIGTLKHFMKRKYRTIEAVKGISFEIEPGEVVGFLGPNGAGKTTALKVLTGLVHPTTGQVEVLGHTPFKRQRDFLRQITLVMGQKQQLIWDLPAMDSLRINAAVYEIPPKEFEKRLGELCEMLDLKKELTQPVRKLSLGQRMKAEFMAAMIHHPKVLFLDEPTLGLDINAQTAVRSFLRDYNQKHQAAILLTSHYMADITALCQRVLLIHEGKLMYDGSLDRLVEQFSPYREVKLELAGEVSAEQLASFGEVESVEGRMARLIIRREELTATIGRLLDQLNVKDLTITDPPVEQIISKIFKQGKVD
jgi:ABC-2 type transport system ATP-binding protein